MQRRLHDFSPCLLGNMAVSTGMDILYKPGMLIKILGQNCSVHLIQNTCQPPTVGTVEVPPSIYLWDLTFCRKKKWLGHYVMLVIVVRVAQWVTPKTRIHLKSINCAMYILVVNNQLLDLSQSELIQPLGDRVEFQAQISNENNDFPCYHVFP